MTQLLLVVLLLVLAVPGVAAAQPGPIIRSVVMQNAATATGNGTSLDTSQASIAILQTTISGTATVTFEASVDGTTWSGLYCALLAATNPVTGVTNVGTSTASNMYRCNVAGIPIIRARVSAYTSGTVTVKGLATSLPSGSGNSMAN